MQQGKIISVALGPKAWKVQFGYTKDDGTEGTYQVTVGDGGLLWTSHDSTIKASAPGAAEPIELPLEAYIHGRLA